MLPIILEVAFGTISGVAIWAVGALFSHEGFSWEGFGNAVIDSFLFSSLFAFVSSTVNAAKCASRSGATVIDGVEIQHAQKSDFTPEAWDRIQSLQHKADGSTISSMKDGRFIHKGFKSGFGKEFRIPHGRLDFYDEIGNVIYELKPNNASSITRGIKQLYKYNEIMGGGYKLVLVLY